MAIFAAMDSRFWAEVLARLGRRLAPFGQDEGSRRAIRQAVERNPWFCEESIGLAVKAIREKMLDPAQSERWLADYRGLLAQNPARSGKKLGIIMAGNIPLVGFFDLLCGLVCGYDCHVKPSGKDGVLLSYIIDLLKEEGVGQIRLADRLDGVGLDRLIATGSDQTIAMFQGRFGEVPALWRGSRSSVAVLCGEESDAQLGLLAGDVFSHCGLGCRNVSRLFVPAGYDPEHLAGIFAAYTPVHPKYRNNYLQSKAMLAMRGEEFTDGGFFVLQPYDSFPVAISRIAYSFYDSPAQVDRWIETHEDELQCVVCGAYTHPWGVPFGQAQYPTLWDYPDRRDTIEFLCRAPGGDLTGMKN